MVYLQVYTRVWSTYRFIPGCVYLTVVNPGVCTSPLLTRVVVLLLRYTRVVVLLLSYTRVVYITVDNPGGVHHC